MTRRSALPTIAGNRQYITLGNLAGNDRAFLFLIDFANRQRIKLWGRARVVEGDDALIAKLFDNGYRAKPERVILFTVEAWDVNCSQHITPRFTQADIATATQKLPTAIAALEAENAGFARTLSAAAPTGLDKRDLTAPFAERPRAYVAMHTRIGPAS